MTRRALITGIRGQDGTYLAELLLRRGYEVHGLVRPDPAAPSMPLDGAVALHEGDLCNGASISNVIRELKPDEIYHLAGQSEVEASFARAEETGEVVGLGTLRVLEAMRAHASGSRLFHAGSSAMFSVSEPLPHSETTRTAPVTPYAAAKLFATNLVSIYRRRYSLFAVSGFLFNHESPRRPGTFVSQKIARAAARIAAGLEDTLSLGSMDVRRDWGFAGDYVNAMTMMLAAARPDDYVIATGQSHSVRDFCELAFTHAGLDHRRHVVFDPRLVREVDVVETRGDPSKIARELGWHPAVEFSGLVAMMVDAQRAVVEGSS